MLRVRTGPEYPEDNLRELTTDSNPECGIAILPKALRHRQARSQNKGLSRASRLWASPPPTRDRQARVARAGRGQSRPQRGIIYQTASRLRC